VEAPKRLLLNALVPTPVFIVPTGAMVPIGVVVLPIGLPVANAVVPIGARVPIVVPVPVRNEVVPTGAMVPMGDLDVNKDCPVPITLLLMSVLTGTVVTGAIRSVSAEHLQVPQMSQMAIMGAERCRGIEGNSRIVLSDQRQVSQVSQVALMGAEGSRSTDGRITLSQDGFMLQVCKMS